VGAYAKGTNALGQCQRCGFVYKRRLLRQDGDTNILVCRSCYDIEHPAEKPRSYHDPEALQRPAPDLDKAASRTLSAGLLAAEMGWDHYFGGGT
jgi:hypothetical protein